MDSLLPAANLIVALPSKGNLAEPCEGFFARAGLPIYKPNRRQYSATIPRLPLAEVVYQRPLDILNQGAGGAGGYRRDRPGTSWPSTARIRLT